MRRFRANEPLYTNCWTILKLLNAKDSISTKDKFLLKIKFILSLSLSLFLLPYLTNDLPTQQEEFLFSNEFKRNFWASSNKHNKNQPIYLLSSNTKTIMFQTQNTHTHSYTHTPLHKHTHTHTHMHALTFRHHSNL